MRRTILLISILCSAKLLFAQFDTLPEPSYDSRTHFSGKKGKWNFSGVRLYKDSVLFYSDVYGGVHGDTTVHYIKRTWFYTNGKKKRYVYVNFKNPRRAKIVDKTFSKSGEVTNEEIMKAKRLPEQNNPNKVEWKKK